MGCDKTTPSLLMGAASCDLPTDWTFGRTHAFRKISRPRFGIGNRGVANDRSSPRRAK